MIPLKRKPWWIPGEDDATNDEKVALQSNIPFEPALRLDARPINFLKLRVAILFKRRDV